MLASNCPAEVDDLVAAFLAGVVDSDGTIGFRRDTYAMRVSGLGTQPTFHERVCVRQIEPQAVDLLHAAFGGYRGVVVAATRSSRSILGRQSIERRPRFSLPYSLTCG